MTEDTETSSREPAMDVGASPSPPAPPGDGASLPTQQPAGGAPSPPTQQPASGAPSVQERAVAIVHERPEVGVGAAFGGGLILALILKRIAR